MTASVRVVDVVAHTPLQRVPSEGLPNCSIMSALSREPNSRFAALGRTQMYNIIYGYLYGGMLLPGVSITAKTSKLNWRMLPREIGNVEWVGSASHNDGTLHLTRKSTTTITKIATNNDISRLPGLPWESTLAFVHRYLFIDKSGHLVLRCFAELEIESRTAETSIGRIACADRYNCPEVFTFTDHWARTNPTNIKVKVPRDNNVPEHNINLFYANGALVPVDETVADTDRHIMYITSKFAPGKIYVYIMYRTADQPRLTINVPHGWRILMVDRDYIYCIDRVAHDKADDKAVEWIGRITRPVHTVYAIDKFELTYRPIFTVPGNNIVNMPYAIKGHVNQQGLIRILTADGELLME